MFWYAATNCRVLLNAEGRVAPCAAELKAVAGSSPGLLANLVLLKCILPKTCTCVAWQGLHVYVCVCTMHVCMWNVCACVHFCMCGVCVCMCVCVVCVWGEPCVLSDSSTGWGDTTVQESSPTSLNPVCISSVQFTSRTFTRSNSRLESSRALTCQPLTMQGEL